MNARICTSLVVGGLALGMLVLPARARDRGADGQFSKRRSSHFVLHQDVAIDQYSGPGGTRRFERDVLEVLEQAHAAVSEVLGLRPHQSVNVVVYDATVFDAQFAPLFRFRAAGFYNGAIHVRSGTEVGTSLVRTLHHEYTHAALAQTASSIVLPGWLNEGLAEYMERLAIGQRHLTPGEDSALRRVVAQGAWIPLADLGAPSFSRLPGRSAGLAYLESYAIIEFLARSSGRHSLERLCEVLTRTSSADRALEKVFRMDLAKAETALLHELR